MKVKKVLSWYITMFLMFSVSSFAVDDIEALLLQDDSMWEAQLMSEEKEGQEFKGEIIRLVGQAMMQRIGEESWKQAFQGMELVEGATVVTMENSEAKIKLENGAIVSLKPKTQAFFSDLRQDPEQEELTETGIKLVVGTVYSNVKRLSDTGSKYEINTDGATAGVRGTKFSSSKDEQGNFEVTVYEGVVDFTSVQTPKPIQVNAGERIRSDSMGNPSPKENHDLAPPEDLEEQPVETAEDAEAEEEVADEGEQAEPAKRAADTDSGASAGYGVTMEAGSTRTNETMYSTLEIKPDFKNIFGSPLGVGLNIIVQQGEDEDGNPVTKFGPAAKDDWYNGVTIRWAEYEGKSFGIRYGDLGGVNYGHGMLMNNYNTFGLKLRVSPEKFALKGFMPLSESEPLKLDTDEKKTVYGARGEYAIWKNVRVGATYVTDTNEDINEDEMPKGGIAGDVFVPLSRLLIPYAEYAMLNNFGSGYGVGIRGGLGIINYRMEYRGIGDEFAPGLYDGYYDYGIDLKDMPGYAGYLAQTGIGLSGVGGASLKYEDYDTYGKVVSGEGSIIKMAFLPGMWARLQAGGEYRQKVDDFDDFTWDDIDAEYSAFVNYPASSSVDINIKYIKEAGLEEPYQTFRTIIRF